ncbi:MAG TPA: gamma-glutamyl-gamma-aminobutyrate hydrolase family protein [Chloroflexota bacterium]|nr:gamma-glutamyl-gamma-aminobutyrate hydrolase family protein [Chloroflexota bacterium]
MGRPLIGITCGTLTPEHGEPAYGANQAYVQALQQAGALVVLIPPGGVAAASALVERLDGLLLPGGADIDPRSYGEEPVDEVTATYPERDELEIAALCAARERGTPVFGICRGQQLINVALGGTLYQDLPSQLTLKHDDEAVPHRTARELGRDYLGHEIEVRPESRLRSILGQERLWVNTFHHQAVKSVAPGLMVTATSPDGVTEGLETPDGRILAVQCHPEELTHLEWAAALFRAFVEQARRP